MNDTKTQKLLDALEDARYDAHRFRRLFTLSLGATIIGVLMVMFGVILGVWGNLTNVDTGGAAFGSVFPGIVLAGLAGLATVSLYFDEGGKTQKTLRAAERAYRDYLNTQL